MSAKANQGERRALRRAARQARHALRKAPRHEPPWGSGLWSFIARPAPTSTPHEPATDAFHAATVENARTGPAPAWGWTT